MSATTTLHAIKWMHTLIWAFFAACILAVPFFTHAGRLRVSAVLLAVVGVEVIVLALNHGRCPLTDIAARHTEERADNFDIYLPEWLARHNKTLFGTLFVAGGLYTLVQWLAGQAAPG